ncbi:SwmB domain-containing protein [Formosa haliotis]|uniref:SwmB domain-containing protein n=1 Tax=Formosa haliotis TaxID=1555194 RepID=UPI000826B4DD|nr:SwmB domain-containing protein [Formosa haliotis]
MKTYKNIVKVLCIAALGFTACNDDNDIHLEEPSQRVIYTSQMDFENKVEVGNYITFGDVSPGVISRTWTFPENITNVQGNQSSEDIVKAYFYEPGVYDVKLHQVFKNDAYVDENLMGKELDTTIVVNILNPLSINITANYINPDGTLGAALNFAEGAENIIEASRSVRYTYNIVGEPETTTWHFEGGTPLAVENTETVDVKYRKMGTFGLDLLAKRDRPFGEAIESYENVITVIASTDPVTLDATYNFEDAIALEFSREMDPESLNPSDFSVTITNGETVLNPMVASASVDAIEGNRVLLTLANESTYNDDQVTVSYTPGTLQTLDGVAVDALTDVPMVFRGENLFNNGIVDYGFENTMSTDWVYQWWGTPWDKYKFNISTAQAYDGDKSGYVVVDAGGGMIIGQVDSAGEKASFTVKAGQAYELGVWVYVESLGQILPDALPPDVRFYWAPATDWSVGGNPTFTADYAVGEWVYSSQIVEFAEAGPTTISIRANNQNNPQELKFYMDNLTLIEANLRP